MSYLMQMVYNGTCRWVCFTNLELLEAAWAGWSHTYMAKAYSNCMENNCLLCTVWGSPSTLFTWKKGWRPNISRRQSAYLQGSGCHCIMLLLIKKMPPAIILLLCDCSFISMISLVINIIAYHWEKDCCCFVSFEVCFSFF